MYQDKDDVMRHIRINEGEQVCRTIRLFEVHHKHLDFHHLLRVRDIEGRSRQLVKPSDIHHIIDEARLHARVHLHELVEHRLRHNTADDGALWIVKNVIHGHLPP